MSDFVHTQGIETVHAGGKGQKWQHSVNVVVECPLSQMDVIESIFKASLL